MNLNPNVAALLVAVFFAIGVFPWTATARQLGPPGVYLFVGGAYVAVGLVWAALKGFNGPLTTAACTTGVVTGLLYAAAVGLSSYGLGHRAVVVPVFTAITATYPLMTALIAVALLNGHLTGWQKFFLLTGTASVVGLSLTGKQ